MRHYAVKIKASLANELLVIRLFPFSGNKKPHPHLAHMRFNFRFWGSGEVQSPCHLLRILTEKTVSVHFLINFADQRQCSWLAAHCHLLSCSLHHYRVCGEWEGRREPRRFFRLLFQIPWKTSGVLSESAIKKPLAGLTNQVNALPFSPRKKPIRGIATGEFSAKKLPVHLLTT
ncbi:hypothetical protein [Pseudomonas sp. P5_C3]